jgi:hypothetical protein
MSSRRGMSGEWTKTEGTTEHKEFMYEYISSRNNSVQTVQKSLPIAFVHYM